MVSIMAKRNVPNSTDKNMFRTWWNVDLKLIQFVIKLMHSSTVNSRYNQVGYNEVPAYNEVVQWSGNPSILLHY